MNLLFPKQPIFAEHFREISTHITTIAQVFCEYAQTFDRHAEYRTRASDIEHAADRVTYGIIKELNESFITPFDREDIYLLANRLDDIVDTLENVFITINLYRLTTKRPFVDDFARLIVDASEELQKLIHEVFSANKLTKDSQQHIVRIHELEGEADGVYERELGKLFEEINPIEIMKWRDILENLENTMDELRKVSNIIEGIMIKSQ